MEKETGTDQEFFHIPEHRMGEFTDKIAALNKRAAKLGVAGITFSVIESYDRKYTEHPFTGAILLTPMIIRFNKVSVAGIAPKFAGWSFLARIDHEPNGVNIIAAVPGVELNERYRTLGNVCEHCRINRYRKSSFVVRHEDGTEKQVGSACLKDFLGHGAPEKVAGYCESLFTFIKSVREDDYIYGGEFEHRHDLGGLLSLTVAVIRKYGWVSGAKARDFNLQSTADMMREYIYGKGKYADEMRREVGGVNEDDKALAKLAIDWVKGLDGKLNDYQHNIKAVCSNESITDKHLGIAVSIIPAYQREVEGIMQRAAKVPSQWIGHPDTGREKLQNVKVIGVSTFEGYNGIGYVYRFLANGKDKLTWFASSDQKLNQDDTLDIAFGVKKLDEYKGEHITIITRAKFTRKEGKAA